jgi:quercetin dioxygenase-like cupin family protein
METSMNEVSFAQFEVDARARGFDTVLERVWPPNAVLDTHSHDFAVEARVVQGELWLTVGEYTRHLRAGDRFELAARVPHAERYGAEGATFWTARRTLAG